MIKIKCRTKFDITATGITGHFKPSRIPFKSKADKMITDENSWNRARNQQRNWETLTQLIQLRTQILDLSDPVCDIDEWSFEFFTESEVFHDGTDPVGILKSDSNGVPMLYMLDNDPDIESILVTEGPRQNIWFEAEPINIL